MKAQQARPDEIEANRRVQNAEVYKQTVALGEAQCKNREKPAAPGNPKLPAGVRDDPNGR